MRKNPFDNDFDPYDALVELNNRLSRLEQVHNVLAHDYQKTQKELNIALDCLNSLQKSHLALTDFVGVAAIKKFDIKPEELKAKNKS